MYVTVNMLSCDSLAHILCLKATSMLSMCICMLRIRSIRLRAADLIILIRWGKQIELARKIQNRCIICRAYKIESSDKHTQGIKQIICWIGVYLLGELFCCYCFNKSVFIFFLIACAFSKVIVHFIVVVYTVAIQDRSEESTGMTTRTTIVYVYMFGISFAQQIHGWIHQQAAVAESSFRVD